MKIYYKNRKVMHNTASYDPKVNFASNYMK